MKVYDFPFVLFPIPLSTDESVVDEFDESCICSLSFNSSCRDFSEGTEREKIELQKACMQQYTNTEYGIQK